MFKVKQKKTGEVLTVFNVRVNGKGETEFLFNTYCEYAVWYWDDADDYTPVLEEIKKEGE